MMMVIKGSETGELNYLIKIDWNASQGYIHLVISAVCEPQNNDNILNNVNSPKNSTALIGLKHCFNRKRHITRAGYCLNIPIR